MTQPSAPLSLAFVASDRPEAQAARRALIQRYGAVSEADADVIVANRHTPELDGVREKVFTRDIFGVD